jgi:mono/diheme cytochrome c family protein
MLKSNSAMKAAGVAALLLLGAPSVLAQAAASAPAAAMPSAAAGRELFAMHCVRCHGAEARGTANGPDLRPRLRGMSEDAFGNAVLRRYRWSVPAAEAAGESGARDALLRGLLEPRPDAAAMPAWESQPAVAQGIRSLYRYLSPLR